MAPFHPLWDSHAGSTHTINSENGTSYQSTNRIPTVASPRYSNHESSDAYFNYAQPPQFLHHSPHGSQFRPSHPMAQFQPSSQTSELSTWNLPYPATARNPLPRPLNLEENLRPSEETLSHVNSKQFDRILKRRVTRERLGWTPGSRRSYLHESRHKHATRRPRGPGGRFLNNDEFKRQETDLTNRQMPHPGNKDRMEHKTM